MLPPIRCFSCNALVRFREFDELREERVPKGEAMDRLGARRYCCRRMLTGIQENLVQILIAHDSTGFVNGFTRLQLGVDATPSSSSSASSSSPESQERDERDENGCSSIERVFEL